MKPAAIITDATEQSAADAYLQEFGELLINPSRIDAVVPGPVLIDGEPIDEGHCAVIVSGKVITVLGRNEAMSLYHAAKRGCIR